VSISLLLDIVPLRGTVDIGSFMIPPESLARGKPVADADAANESAANKKVAIVIVIAQCYGAQR
jgi:hypothetical protein